MASSPRRHVGYIKDGKFVSGEVDENVVNNPEHPLHRQYVRDRMREDYAQDIEQPFKHGKANPGYIEAFGREEATKQFSEQQINEVMENR